LQNAQLLYTAYSRRDKNLKYALPYLTFGVDAAHRQHPVLRPLGGPIVLI